MGPGGGAESRVTMPEMLETASRMSRDRSQAASTVTWAIIPFMTWGCPSGLGIWHQIT